MDHRIAIVLIVMGALLVAVPPASDYLHGRNVVEASDTTATQAKGRWSINVGERMSKQYRFGCWALGAGMIGIGVLCSLGAGRHGGSE